jgi:hypothetical protein
VGRPHGLRPARRDDIEPGLLRGIQAKLLAPEVVDEFCKRLAKRMAAQRRKPDVSGVRIAGLEAEVGNLADAIAEGC